MPRQYITTAIDFPNGAPHMGHVMEKVMADVCARWFRLRGDEVRFQIGTDDHGIKIQRTAEKEGMKPRDYVNRNIPAFRELFDLLNISYDCFMSTSVTEGHYETAQALWRRLTESGHLRKQTYTGLYCAGCEEFKIARDLEDGKCPNHQVAPEEVAEENWFFDLSKHQDFLKDLLSRKDGYSIVPEFRAKEVFGFLDRGLEDVSFSRPNSTLYWGVPVPDDDNQVMYVWCDNLTNYISTLGYLTEKQDPTWWDEAEVTHIVGKDITRFHGLNWPAMLHAAGIKTPDRLLVHGFITCDGSKMSKSLGNVVVPADVLDHFAGNPDPLRFYLSHEIPVGNDGDFSWERIEALYDAKLRNDLGNLLNRVLVLLHKEGCDLGSFGDPTFLTAKQEAYEQAMNAFDYSKAIQEAMQIATDANKYIDDRKPWGLSGDEKKEVLTQLAEALRHLSLALLPFTPDTAKRISKQLNVPYADKMLDIDFTITDDMKKWGGIKDWKAVGKPEILFAQLEFSTPKKVIPLQKTLRTDLTLSVASELREDGMKLAYAVLRVPKNKRKRGKELQKYIDGVVGSLDIDELLQSPVTSEFKRLQKEAGVTDGLTPAEHLLGLIQKSGMFPNITQVVDCYNIVSASTLLSMGAHDLEHVKGNLRMVVTDGSEHYIPLGGSDPVAIGPGEYAAMDDEKIICRMDIKQCNETRITEDTTDFVMYVQGNKETTMKYVKDALQQVCKNISQYCDGEYKMLEVA